MSIFRTRILAAVAVAALAIAASCSTSEGVEAQPTAENSESMTSPSAEPDTAATANSEPQENSDESIPETQQDSEPATPAVTDESPEPAEPAGPQPCTAAGIDLSIGEGDGAMGSVYYPLVFTNTGDDECTLAGFPGVSYVTGGDGTQLGGSAEWEGPEGDVVTVAPGDSTSVTVREVNVHFFDPQDCEPAEADGLRVYLPGETSALYTPQDHAEGCAIDPLPGGQLQLSVTAFGSDE